MRWDGLGWFGYWGTLWGWWYIQQFVYSTAESQVAGLERDVAYGAVRVVLN